MTARIDRGLLRFLRARVDESAALNDGGSLPEVPSQCASPDLPERLVTAAVNLRRAAVGADGSSVAYSSLATLDEFRRLRTLTAQLICFEPSSLGERADRLAFWLNVYNTLAIEAVVVFEVQESVRQLPGFFRRAAYRIGGQRWSLEEIEHGVLRGNRPPLPGLPAPFAAGDPRLALVIKPPDPRIHCALNCAARSCPPLHFYRWAAVDAQLDLACEAFVQSGGVSVADGRVTLSPLFEYYAGDFAAEGGVAAWICGRVSNVLEAEQIRAAFADGRVCYDDYDWALNGPSLRQ